MKVYLGADHGGYRLKEKIKVWLTEWGYDFDDLGAKSLNPNDDYPDFVIPVAEKVAHRQAQGMPSMGIVLGRSGNGEAIAANKVKGVRAALCVSVQMAIKAREHNKANVLSLGEDYIKESDAKKIVKMFFNTKFTGDLRHKRRLKKISEYEHSN
jgi:ribose 5-phosphate isomerase B